MSNHNGFRCGHCARLFPRSEMIEREYSILHEDLGGRLTPLARVAECCPYCGSDSLDPAFLCDRCGVIESVEGSDECFTCQMVIEAEEHEELLKRESEQRRRELIAVLLP